VRQQSVRSPDEDTASTRSQRTRATAVSGPQIGRNLGFATSDASLPTRLGQELEKPQFRPRRRIAVAVTRPIRFPVLIRTI